jgi:hypothetical protein
MIDAAALGRYRAHFAKWCEQNEGVETGVDLSAITSTLEMIAYCASSVRAEGHDDETVADAVQLLVELAGIDRVKLREAARTLARLGYSDAVVGRIKHVAKKARRPTHHPSWQERMTSRAQARLMRQARRSTRH